MNQRKTIILAALGAIFLVSPAFASADTVVRSGESVSVEKDQKIDGDFYSAASILNISGEVTEDLIGLSGKTTLNGPVGKDALLVGGSVDVHGGIGDDLRVIGGDVIIAEPVTGDVFVFGGSVKVLSTASIGGDLLLYGGDAEISGSVGGDIVGQINTLRIDAPVAGSIDVTVNEMTIGDRADITGPVRYISATVITRAQNAKVGGEVTRNDPVEKDTTFGIKTILVPVLMVLFASLVWYLMARRVLVHIIDRALSRSVRPITLGFITFFAAPVIIVILIASVLGAVVGITGIFAYLLMILLSVVSGAAILGQFIMNQIRKEAKPLDPLTLALGVGVMTLCVFIPLVGPSILIILFMTTLGAIVDLLLRPNAS